MKYIIEHITDFLLNLAREGIDAPVAMLLPKDTFERLIAEANQHRTVYDPEATEITVNGPVGGVRILKEPEYEPHPLYQER